MKIYSKTGDGGMTSLASGERVPKYHQRLEFYGTIDELNSYLGLIRVKINDINHHLSDKILQIQNRLFDIGNWVAITAKSELADHLERITPSMYFQLEKEIDALSDQLPSQGNFIIPGGSELASHLHIARTICRRSERIFVKFTEAEEVPVKIEENYQNILIYLNRLSDFLFVLARFVNKIKKIEDTKYKISKVSR